MTLDVSLQRDWKWPLWAVLALSIPSFTALVITVYVLVRPSVWAYALVPLIYFLMPAGLVVAASVAVLARRFMPHHTIRNTWITLVFAVVAALVTITLVWAGSKTH